MNIERLKEIKKELETMKEEANKEIISDKALKYFDDAITYIRKTLVELICSE